MNSLLRRIGGSLVFGFLLVFAFAFFMQGTTDLVNWISGHHIRFMFPMGLSYALTDRETLFSILTSLSFTSLVAAAIFFVVKSKKRPGIFDLDDDPDPDPDSDPGSDQDT